MAYIQFGSEAQATKALKALNGSILGGRTIRVDYAEHSKQFAKKLDSETKLPEVQ